MSQDKRISDAIFKAGLSVHLVLGKTQELLRMLTIKLPVGRLKQAELCRHLIAIEIACLVLNLPLDKKKLIEQSDVNSKIYLEGLRQCKQVLKIQRESDVLQRLAVNFGIHLKPAATSLLEQYKKLYVDKLPMNQQALVDINSAVCNAAAFFIIGQKNKVSLDTSNAAICLK